MPELPDVENYRRYLNATALHKRIEAVHVSDTRFLEETSVPELRAGLTGHAFASTRRHGKYLLIAIDAGGWLASHYGMTGNLRYFKRTDKHPDHERVCLDFANGYHLAFVSQRMLGHLRLIDDADRFLADWGLGPDALEIAADRSRFREMLAGRRGGIKSALMDQAFIAGLGNVYSDEILFQARLDPRAAVRDLDEDAVDRLFDALHDVLTTAIDCGAGSEGLADRLPDGFLLAHREKSGTCPRCGSDIEARKVAGRTAYMCPRCQR